MWKGSVCLWCFIFLCDPLRKAWSSRINSDEVLILATRIITRVLSCVTFFNWCAWKLYTHIFILSLHLSLLSQCGRSFRSNRNKCLYTIWSNLWIWLTVRGFGCTNSRKTSRTTSCVAYLITKKEQVSQYRKLVISTRWWIRQERDRCEWRGGWRNGIDVSE